MYGVCGAVRGHGRCVDTNLHTGNKHVMPKLYEQVCSSISTCTDQLQEFYLVNGVKHCRHDMR